MWPWYEMGEKERVGERVGTDWGYTVLRKNGFDKINEYWEEKARILPKPYGKSSDSIVFGVSKESTTFSILHRIIFQASAQGQSA